MSEATKSKASMNITFAIEVDLTSGEAIEDFAKLLTAMRDAGHPEIGNQVMDAFDAEMRKRGLPTSESAALEEKR